MTQTPSNPADRWYSAQHTDHCVTNKLEQGQIVIAGRRPFRIDRVAELPSEKWPEEFVSVWLDRGMPDAEEWRDRPMRVTGFWEGPDADTRGHGTTAPASHMWDVLPEHYAVCHKCFELPPCRHVHNERVMQRATARMTEDMSILPGTCHGCREPITKRQKSFTFPGANLIRPDLGDHSAIFHTRSKCYGALTAYDKRWAAAEPDRTRLFFCEGARTIHHTGDVDCDNPQCLAKGDLKDLVDHRCSIWHRPGTPGRLYDAMRDFGRNPGEGNDTCWCLTDADRRNAA
jgi:hypothetical protein